MKILKIVLIVLGALIVLVLLAGLLAPKSYQVEREITINRPQAEVFGFLKYLKNQDKFSVLAKMDPNMKQEFRGTDGEVGFVSVWESENRDVGKGEQEIKNIVEGERIDYEIRFLEPFESVSTAFITTTAVDSAVTRVVWGFSGDTPYPMNIMLWFMNMDEMVGNDLQKGLENLKALLENQNAEKL